MLIEKIDSYIQTARKSGDINLLNTYQDIKVELMKLKTAKNAKEITEDVEISLIKKMFSECVENAVTFSNAGREDLADMERAEAGILSSFLPVEATEDDIVSVIRELTNNSMVIDKKSMGTFIKEIKSKLKNVDGKLVADTVKKYIQ
jgi:hypothetical protein